MTFFCKVATKQGGTGRTQSLSDEEEEGGSGDEGSQQEKVTSAALFTSDEDPTSPEAKRKSDIPPPKSDSKKAGLKPNKVPKETTDNKEEEDSDGSGDSDSSPEMELSGREEEIVKVSSTDNPALVKARLKKWMEVYLDDRTVARLVRGSIMGLKGNKEPTQGAIESSKLF